MAPYAKSQVGEPLYRNISAPVMRVQADKKTLILKLLIGDMDVSLLENRCIGNDMGYEGFAPRKRESIRVQRTQNSWQEACGLASAMASNGHICEYTRYRHSRMDIARSH